MRELTMRLVTTPMKQAIAKKMRANLVFVRIFISYRLSKAKEKVNKKILAIILFFW
jgi:hypothetical protein